MKIIEIKNKEIYYPVYIGERALEHLIEHLNINQSVLVITDDLVKKLYLNDLKTNLTGYQIYVFSMGSAEENKNLSCYEQCVNFALERFLDRHVQVIAFGGGAVGDFAGFFASTYKRGVPFFNIPTTLLAHDSAIGGKVALNLGGVKNVVGSFYQPKAVFYNTKFLKSLNDTEIRSGFGEIFKHDLLSDGSITKSLKSISNLKEVVYNHFLMGDILYRCINIKKQYIIDDVHDDLGIRQALNLGHTLAHAIEILYHYSHGESVSFGMCFDLYVSNNPDFKTYYERFKNFGYFSTPLTLNISDITDVVKNDKKNKNGFITIIGLEKTGDPKELHLTEEMFIQKLNEFKNLIKNW